MVGLEPTTPRVLGELSNKAELHSDKVTTWTTGGKYARSMSDLAVLVGIEPTNRSAALTVQCVYQFRHKTIKF